MIDAASDGFRSADRTAMLVKVARLYHEQGLRQPDIAERLHMSQSRVSRMLKEAAEAGIVRTVVVPPPGGHADLEERVRERFRLVDVVVADTEGAPTDEASMVRSIGASAANYFAATLTGG